MMMNMFQYLEEKYSTADRDETFSFCFNDSVNGYIELNFTKPQTRSNKGWEIEPHRSPVRVSIVIVVLLCNIE